MKPGRGMAMMEGGRSCPRLRESMMKSDWFPLAVLAAALLVALLAQIMRSA